MNDQTRALTQAEHQQRHKELHDALDELVSDFIMHTEKLPTKTSVYNLMQWSYRQTQVPTELSPPRSPNPVPNNDTHSGYPEA